MDQRQNSIEPGERFRAGKHTEGVSNHNPALRPHGVVDEAELAKAPVRPVPGLPAEPADDSKVDSQSLLEAVQESIDVETELGKEK